MLAHNKTMMNVQRKCVIVSSELREGIKATVWRVLEIGEKGRLETTERLRAESLSKERDIFFGPER